MRSILIVEPGPLATVQDRGRYGLRAWGVPLSGAMDPQAFRIANLLIGNADNAAGIEITLGGFQARFGCAAHFAVTGAIPGAFLNGAPVESWRAHRAKEGDLLRIDIPNCPPHRIEARLSKNTRESKSGSGSCARSDFSHPGLPSFFGEATKRFCASTSRVDKVFFPGCGLRTYLAVSGGIDLPLVMQSRSTYLRGGFGGLGGRALRAGDELPLGTPTRRPKDHPAPAALIPPYGRKSALHVITGPQDERVSPAGMAAFFSQWYEVSNRADRMGISLSGTPLELTSGADIISDGTCPGAVQVHGNGLPTILGADSQTTGGYIKIATVISTDLPLVAQLAPGARVRFSNIDLWRAREIYMGNEFRIRNSLL